MTTKPNKIKPVKENSIKYNRILSYYGLFNLVGSVVKLKHVEHLTICGVLHSVKPIRPLLFLIDHCIITDEATGKIAYKEKVKVKSENIIYIQLVKLPTKHEEPSNIPQIKNNASDRSTKANEKNCNPQTQILEERQQQQPCVAVDTEPEVKLCSKQKAATETDSKPEMANSTNSCQNNGATDSRENIRMSQHDSLENVKEIQGGS